jgi:hypothetical protein
VITQRDYSAHHLARETARAAIARAKAGLSSEREGALTAVIMSAIAVEALANTVGVRVVSGWDDYDNLRAVAKWRLICATLEIAFDPSSEPWLSANWVMAFRNGLVHPKPVQVKTERIIPLDEFNEMTTGKVEFPPSVLESKLTIANAERALQAFAGVLDALTFRLSPEHGSGIFSDSMQGGATIVPRHHSTSANPRAPSGDGTTEE